MQKLVNYENFGCRWASFSGDKLVEYLYNLLVKKNKMFDL